MRNGNITVQYTVWCAKCPYWYMADENKKTAIQEFRALGWKNKRGIGWVCPVCVKEDAK